MAYCKACLEKDLKIEELKERSSPCRQTQSTGKGKSRKDTSGASTPSSKLPCKEKAPEENDEQKGGGVPGHQGHGRPSHTEETPIQSSPGWGEDCPDCGGAARHEKGAGSHGHRKHADEARKASSTVLPSRNARTVSRVFRAKPPRVLPKSLYGNQLMAQIAVMHYFHGIPMGRITEMTGISLGRSFNLSPPGPILRAADGSLAQEYRRAPVKHADETGWRNDGQSGYAWLFCTAALEHLPLQEHPIVIRPEGRLRQ